MVLIALIFLGLCLGSFVNALVWRVHEQSKLEKKKSLTKNDKNWKSQLSILNGRSMCPHCKHELSVLDLIPVFSWLMLRGKCKYCQKPISWQYPAVELATMVVFIASYIWWPVHINGVQIAEFSLWLILCVGLVALILYDLKWMTLPTRIIYSLWPVAAVLVLLNIVNNHNHIHALINTLVGLLIGGGIFYGLFQASNGRWIGGGDVRLGFLLGFVAASPERSILLLFMASILGTLISLPLIASKKLKKTSVIPFGPFLIIGLIIVQLFGSSILSTYNNNFFPNGL